MKRRKEQNQKSFAAIRNLQFKPDSAATVIDVDLFDFEFSSAKSSLFSVIADECHSALFDVFRLDRLYNWRYISDEIEDDYNLIVKKISPRIFQLDPSAVKNISEKLSVLEGILHRQEWVGEFEEVLEFGKKYQPENDFSNSSGSVNFKYHVKYDGENIQLELTLDDISSLNVLKNDISHLYDSHKIEYGTMELVYLESQLENYISPFFASEMFSHEYQDKQYGYFKYYITRRPWFTTSSLQIPHIYSYILFSNGIENAGTETLNVKAQYLGVNNEVLHEVVFTEELHDPVFYTGGAYERATFERHEITESEALKITGVKLFWWRTADTGSVIEFPIHKVPDIINWLSSKL